MNCSVEFPTTPNPHCYMNATNNGKNIQPYIAFVSVLSINLILGISINSYVLWLIFKGKGNGISAEFFSLNLAVCEILFCVIGFSYILSIQFLVFVYISSFAVALPLFGRPLFQCLICTERYLAVLRPVSFLKYKPLRYRLACSALAWLTILCICVFCGLNINSRNMYAFFSILLPPSLILFTVNFCCSLAILKALKYPKAGPKGKDREEANQIKRKAFNLVLIITTSVFIQSLPVYIVGILFGSLSQAGFEMSWAVTNIISMMMAYVSPVLFIYRAKKS